MRTNIIIITICVVLGFAATYALDFQSGPRSAGLVEQGTNQDLPQAPDISLTTLDGDAFDLQDLNGKLVMLNFWATWCAPCKVEFPQMLQLANDDPDIVFLAVSVDTGTREIDRFLRTQDQKHLQHDDVIMVHDPDKAIAQDVFQVFKYPETILVSPSGLMSDKIVGAVDWLSPEILKRLDDNKAL